MPKRRITVNGDVAHVPLTQGYVAVIDAVDVERVGRHSWRVFKHASGNLYAKADIGPTPVLLHRFVMEAEPDVDVDHQDGDGLNCRRGNLRLATKAQNHANRRRSRNSTTGFKGVHLNKASGRYRAMLRHRGKALFLGDFDTPEQAHAAYVSAARRLNGEFANAG